jgi:hypothetical protein
MILQKINALRSFDTSAATRSMTQRHNSDELNLHYHGGDHFKPLHSLLATLLPATYPCI